MHSDNSSLARLWSSSTLHPAESMLNRASNELVRLSAAAFIGAVPLCIMFVEYSKRTEWIVAILGYSTLAMTAGVVGVILSMLRVRGARKRLSVGLSNIGFNPMIVHGVLDVLNCPGVVSWEVAQERLRVLASNFAVVPTIDDSLARLQSKVNNSSSGETIVAVSASWLETGGRGWVQVSLFSNPVIESRLVGVIRPSISALLRAGDHRICAPVNLDRRAAPDELVTLREMVPVLMRFAGTSVPPPSHFLSRSPAVVAVIAKDQTVRQMPVDLAAKGADPGDAARTIATVLVRALEHSQQSNVVM